MVGSSAIYQNTLYALVTIGESRKQVALAALNLDNFSLPPRSDEEGYMSTLFMSENESDVVFKIQDKTIPVHKKVLIRKCQFFANLFNSGMMESRLETIDIDDYEYDTFKEFLRYLYCDKINVNVSQAMKLLFLADKYREEDLQGRCVNILIYNITSFNVYEMLDFAREQDLVLLKDWCVKFFQHRLTLKNITGFIKYLEGQNNPDYRQENSRLIEKAVDFVLKNLSVIIEEVNTKEGVKLYTDFLIKHVSNKNLVKFTLLFRNNDDNDKTSNPIIFSKEMAVLRETVFKFVYKNLPCLNRRYLEEISDEFHSHFEKHQFMKIQEESILQEEASDRSILSEDTEISNVLKADSKVNEKENKSHVRMRGIKRMNPTDSTTEEIKEGYQRQILKKTKQSVRK